RLAAADLRLVQWLARGWARGPREREDGTPGLLGVHPRSWESTKRHFEANLCAISEAGRNAGASIVVCTLGNNLRDSPPFSETRVTGEGTGVRPEALRCWNWAHHKQDAGDLDAAVSLYRKALALEPRWGQAHFDLASCFEASGRYRAARMHYQMSIDVEAPGIACGRSEINRIIKNTARVWAPRGVYLVDTEHALMRRSAHGIPGRRLFTDQCHLRFEGAHVLASAIFRKLADEVLPDSIRAEANGPIEPLSIENCARRLVFDAARRAFEWEQTLLVYRDRAMPGADRLARYVEEIERRAAREAKGVSCRQEETAMQAGSLDFEAIRECVFCLAGAGRNDEALEYARLLTKRFPYRSSAHLTLGSSLLAVERAEEAVGELATALAFHPDAHLPRFYLGNAYELLGEWDKSVAWYREALTLSPQDVQYTTALGVALIRIGETEEGLRTCVQACSLDAGSWRQIGMRLSMLPPGECAFSEDVVGLVRTFYRRLLEANPHDYGMSEALSHTYLNANDLDGLLDTWGRISDAHPDWMLAWFNLGLAFERAGDIKAALASYEKARALDPDAAGTLEAIERVTEKLRHARVDGGA
ncbi:MAG TPA: tetratricopeptide repeat protein, partial [Candidatus Hydrogenedentes bacterium]|nr:tetratricopeptide repeat protein [Candidatus Hydrogenedentota bacterium]